MKSKGMSIINKITWKTVRLGDIGRVVTGKTPSTNDSKNFGGGYPFITIPDLKDQRYVRHTERTISEKGASMLRTIKLPPNSIVVSCLATVGEVGITTRESFSNQQINALIPDSEIVSSDYLYYLFRRLKRQLQSYDGSVYTNISKSKFEDIEVDLPLLNTQKHSVDILSAFDDKVENNNRIIKTLEEMAQAIFKEWFVNFRFFGHENAEFVDSELSRIPKGWEVKNVLEIIRRISVGKKYENKTALSTGVVSILDQGQSGCIGYHNDEPGVLASIDEPVVVFTNHTCNYRLITYPFSAIQNVLPYIGSNGYPTIFIYYLTREKITMQEYKGHWPEFEEQEFLVPPAALAEEFASFVKPMVQKIVEVEHENKKLTTMRDLLLPKLMSGELRV